jgi:sorbitol-specific phosphotransferase system component IIA
MSDQAIADVPNNTVTFGGTSYKIQPIGDDAYTVLVEGVPVGRILYSFGSAQGVPEPGSSTSEDTLYAIGEAWFAALDG